MILCRTLGPVDVSLDGGPAPPELLWRKHLALLVYLARSPRKARSRDHLVGLLWGDRTETAARHSLSEALRVIRRHAGETAVETSRGQVHLVPGFVEVDVDQLEALADSASWEPAAELIAGEFLEGFAVPGASEFEDWLAAERDHWRRRGVEVLVRGSEALSQAGRIQEASTLAGRALTLDPTSERALGATLRCLSLAGDRAGALEHFDRFRERVAEQLGTEPGDEIRALVERVRRERGIRAEVAAGWPDGVSVVRAPLEGRGRELGRLLELIARSASERRAALLVVEGESGVGKTRLLDETLARLRLDGMSIAAARTVEADRSEPWSGVLTLARGGLLEAPGVGAASPEALAAFAAALPVWKERFRNAPVDAAQPLGRALVEILRTALEERPVVVAVDDAQWLDPDSATALGPVLRDLIATPLTVLLALVPHPPRSELDEVRSRIGRDLGGEALRLRALDRTALRRLAERMLPGYDSVALDRVTRRVATDSAGMPLLAVELLRAVALGLDLGTISEAWPAPLHTLDQTLPGDLPDAVVAAIRIGVRRLSPTAQRVLAATAVLGDLVPPALLERALSLGPEETALALDELEWHRWLVSEPRGYSFVARLVRRVVERDLVTEGQRHRVLTATGRTELSAGRPDT
ncbi:MAG TPA: AAA family ATPase [Gemmatimonadales bacterium]|jgi:DNA-binding SARP family transcriptional activator